MQDVFHRFVEQIAYSADTTDLRNALAEIASSLDLPSFAYLFPSPGVGRKVDLISTYPQAWTSHYLHSQYEKMDPVIHQARGTQEPFNWDAHGADLKRDAAATIDGCGDAIRHSLRLHDPDP
ncbi:autoinducer binding domain-containing protein [Mesorhizobium sp. M0904]|uniref:autoinducer binding domain-containing protein n=1 Tax=Mesorhizobium sp. M0904 TaxID=2957022 RepID=UPI00333C183E